MRARRLMMYFLISHSNKTIKAMIAMPVSAIGPQIFRESASLAKNARRMISRPRGLSATPAAISSDIQGHCVRTLTVAPKRLGSPHTIIMTGFSTSILNAPISSPPSAPSIAR